MHREAHTHRTACAPRTACGCVGVRMRAGATRANFRLVEVARLFESGPGLLADGGRDCLSGPGVLADGWAWFAADCQAHGNHERDFPGSGNAIGGADSGGECGVPTRARFHMPTPSHTQDEAWYSFEQARRVACGGLGWAVVHTSRQRSVRLGQRRVRVWQGPVHFIVMDTEMAAWPGSAQACFARA
jgi:hypothetical protein